MTTGTECDDAPPGTRGRALELIAERRATGALTLEEYASAVHRVRAAASGADLDAAVAALPPASGLSAARRRWIFDPVLRPQPPGRPLGRAASEPLEGAPVIRLRVVSFLGGVSVEEPGLPGVGLEATEDALVLRLGLLRGLALRAREIRIPHASIRALRRGAAGPAPATPFTARQSGRLALFGPRARDHARAGRRRGGGRSVREIAVEVDDPDRWLTELGARCRGARTG